MEEEQAKENYLNYLINNGFPSQAQQEGTQHFYRAFAEMDSMLRGDKPLNLGRTIFLVENAYYGNTLKYADYQNFIKQKVDLCNRKIREENLDSKNNMVKNMMLFRLIADTLTFKQTQKEKTIYHLFAHKIRFGRL